MLPDIADPDRHFALLHVANAYRPRVHAVWALDETLGRIVAGTRDPFVGQMRLTWWYQALSTLEQRATRGQPILDALAGQPGVDPAGLAAMVEGWEALLDPLPLSDDALLTYARGRGGVMFDVLASMTGGVRPVRAGEGWAIADFAKRCSDAGTAGRAWSLAEERLASLPAGIARPLRILARLAQADARARGRVERTRWRLFRTTW